MQLQSGPEAALPLPGAMCHLSLRVPRSGLCSAKGKSISSQSTFVLLWQVLRDKQYRNCSYSRQHHTQTAQGWAQNEFLDCKIELPSKEIQLQPERESRVRKHQPRHMVILECLFSRQQKHSQRDRQSTPRKPHFSFEESRGRSVFPQGYTLGVPHYLPWHPPALEDRTPFHHLDCPPAQPGTPFPFTHWGPDLLGIVNTDLGTYNSVLSSRHTYLWSFVAHPR